MKRQTMSRKKSKLRPRFVYGRLKGGLRLNINEESLLQLEDAAIDRHQSGLMTNAPLGGDLTYVLLSYQ